MAEGSQTSINIPQLVAVAVVGFFALRWYLYRRALRPITVHAAAHGGRSVDIIDVEYISVMFPQLDRRAIAWDLHRNGGSVPATTDRIVSGRDLDVPPPTFQPNLPSTPPPAQGAALNSPANRKNNPIPQPDLITRYNLHSRISGKAKEEQNATKSGWNPDKNSRAEALRRRREEMVLAARRRLQEQGEPAQEAT